MTSNLSRHQPLREERERERHHLSTGAAAYSARTPVALCMMSAGCECGCESQVDVCLSVRESGEKRSQALYLRQAFCIISDRLLIIILESAQIEREEGIHASKVANFSLVSLEE